MPCRGAYNEYPQHIFLWRTGENYPRIITKYVSLTSSVWPRIACTQLWPIIAPDKRGLSSKIFFLYFHEKLYCGYSLESPQWGTPNEYHNIIMFLWRKKETINTFWLKSGISEVMLQDSLHKYSVWPGYLSKLQWEMYAMTLLPRKVQISLCIHSVWSVCSFSSWKKPWLFGYPQSASQDS